MKSIERFLSTASASIRPADARLIRAVAARVAEAYSAGETAQVPLEDTTAAVKRELSRNTDLPPSLLLEVGKLIDAIAAKASRKPYTLPVCERGFLKVRINQNFAGL